MLFRHLCEESYTHSASDDDCASVGSLWPVAALAHWRAQRCQAMIVLVTGGRHYHDRNKVFRVLDAFDKHGAIDAVVHGNSSGADAFAHAWAISRHVRSISCPADWGYGAAKNPRAGLDRNTFMLEKYKPDLVIAFPGMGGTAHMIRIACEANVTVVDVELEERNAAIMNAQ